MAFYAPGSAVFLGIIRFPKAMDNSTGVEPSLYYKASSLSHCYIGTAKFSETVITGHRLCLMQERQNETRTLHVTMELVSQLFMIKGVAIKSN